LSAENLRPSLIFPFLARLRPENSSTATGWVETQWSLESCWIFFPQGLQCDAHQ
jgi:hypothetical protein